jgi:hypothetical protein
LREDVVVAVLDHFPTADLVGESLGDLARFVRLEVPGLFRRTGSMLSPEINSAARASLYLLFSAL